MKKNYWKYEKVIQQIIPIHRDMYIQVKGHDEQGKDLLFEEPVICLALVNSISINRVTKERIEEEGLIFPVINQHHYLDIEEDFEDVYFKSKEKLKLTIEDMNKNG